MYEWRRTVGEAGLVRIWARGRVNGRSVLIDSLHSPEWDSAPKAENWEDREEMIVTNKHMKKAQPQCQYEKCKLY